MYVAALQNSGRRHARSSTLAACFALLIASSRATATDVSWTWDGSYDPGFSSTHPGGDASCYYDAASQVLVVGYGTRSGISGYESYFRPLPYAFRDFACTIEYTVAINGYWVDPALSDSPVPHDLGCPDAIIRGHVYNGPAGRLTVLQAFDHSCSQVIDQLLSTADPQAGARYRLTLRRAGTNVSGELEKLVSGNWSLVGTKGPYSLPTLDEPFSYLHFAQAEIGSFGRLLVHSIQVTGTTDDPVCDLCNAANGCSYTCLNVDNYSQSQNPVTPGKTVDVSFDYELSGTDGHIIYAGLVVGDLCLPFYNGTPGQAGTSGSANLSFPAPEVGLYDIQVAVAHVYTAEEFCQAVANGQADVLTLGNLSVVPCADLDGDGQVTLSDLSILLISFGLQCN